jgi:molybdopterin-guanine dinucleotide biosynthesis protein A
MADTTIAGILIGGGSRRMGGAPKGLLPAPDGGEPIAARLARIAREAGLAPVLVGDLADYDGPVALPRLGDRPSGIGPLGGLAALLEHAAEGDAVALACDLPLLSTALLARLATHPTAAPVLAPRMRGKAGFEPLFARYRAPAVLPLVVAAIGRGERSPVRLLDSLTVGELELTDAERAQLVDWDAPGDVRAGRPA